MPRCIELVLQLISEHSTSVRESSLPIVDELNAGEITRFLHYQQRPLQCFRNAILSLVLLVTLAIEQADGKNLDAEDSLVGHDLEQIVGDAVVRRRDRIGTEEER